MKKQSKESTINITKVMSEEVAKLREQLYQLERLVKKQGVILAKTGHSVLELQIAQQKTDITQLELGEKVSSPLEQGAIDTSEFATSGDIEQLVEELQGQLDYYEERSIRRVANNVKMDSSDVIAPLPNADGDLPVDYAIPLPNTVKEFVMIDDLALCKVAEFYGILPFPQSDLEDITDKLSKNLETSIPSFTDATAVVQLAKYTKEEKDVIFDTVARYLGLKMRRIPNTW